MTVNNSRSQNESMNEGATDGKYRKVRPNTTVAPGLGEELVRANRNDLHPFNNYGFIDVEEKDKVSPGSTKVKGNSTARSYASATAYMTNYMTNDQDQ
jgi:hypothetical protein